MNSLEQYFKSYSAAYLTFNSDALLPFFHYPCVIHDLNGVHVIDTEDSLRLYERSMLDLLRVNGVSTIESRVKYMKASESSLPTLNCTVEYILRDSSEHILLDFDYDYVLIKEANTWVILFAQIGMLRISNVK